jgi:hypothetical protein
LLVFAQLRDVLAAKNSSIVTQKNNHGWLVRPQRSQPRLLAIAIRENDIGKLAAKRLRHNPSLPEKRLRS